MAEASRYLDLLLILPCPEVNQDYAHDTCNPSSFVSDAFPRSLHRFVVRVLEAEMAAEGASEKRRGELVHLCARLREPRLDLVGQHKQRFHPAHHSLSSWTLSASRQIHHSAAVARVGLFHEALTTGRKPRTRK